MGDRSELLMPLEDPTPGMLQELRVSPSSRRRAGGGGATPSSAEMTSHLLATSGLHTLTSASADLQRSLLQQQLQQSQREVHALKDELFDSGSRLSEVTAALNEQRIELSALTHRYSATVEKLTSAEADVKRLEGQLVQERGRVSQVRDERERVRQQHREAAWEVERLVRMVEEAESRKGLDERAVKRLLDDRSQYMPTVEVRRMESEMQSSQQSLLTRLTSALDSLFVTNEESETTTFVARSAVLSAATDLETRLVKAEAALDTLHQHFCHYREELDAETSNFLLAVMTENKELWQHLTKLQSEYDLLTAEMELHAKRGEVVPRDQYSYVERQLEHATQRLAKAQKLVESQTALATAHEGEMQLLLQENEALREQQRALSTQHSEEKAASDSKSRALTEADAALKDATAQIQKLQDAIVSERQSTEEAVRTLRDTNTGMQREYEEQLRRVQAQCSATETSAVDLRRQLEDCQANIGSLEAELNSRTQLFDSFKQRSEEAMTRHQRAQLDEVAQVRAVLEEEVVQLRQQAETASQEARSAARAKEEVHSQLQAAEAARRALEAEIATQRAECEQARVAVEEAVRRERAAVAELEQARTHNKDDTTSVAELRRQLERAGADHAGLAAQLSDEQARAAQRSLQLQKDWRDAETARASLQDELKTLRARCAEMEAARQSSEHSVRDREHFMRENLRLHEQYQTIQQENTRLTEELRVVRGSQQSTQQLSQQLADLQHRLRELPQLRQAADDARREMLKAKEETQLLRRERDDLSSKLDSFLEESKAAARMDAEFERALRDASEAAQRLGGQVATAKTRTGSGGPVRDDYRVFANTQPTGRVPSPRSRLPASKKSEKQSKRKKEQKEENITENGSLGDRQKEDFGNLNSTVAITRFGGVDIVTNEVSKRETTTIVSFLGDERFIGEQGLDRFIRNAQNTVFLLKRFIGMRMDDPNLEREMRFVTCEVKGDEEGRLMFGVNYCDDMCYLYPEQVVAMMLQKLRYYVNETATIDPKFPADVKDCVITVPSYYTANQRRLIYQSAEIAGLNCMSLINETTASAVDYGIFRGSSLKESEDEAQVVGILDIGYGATDFLITKFWRGNCKILARTFDRNIGTRDVDYELFKHFSKEVKSKYGVDVSGNKRACLRLLQGCEKLKYLLSANQTAPFNVENLMDVDVSIQNFERSTLESLSASVLDGVRAVVQRGFELSGISPDQFHSIELIGGGCRIPMLKRLVEELLGKPPSFTLNASETTARGCAITAAMLSPKFQVRDFKMTELPTYPLLLGYWVENPSSPSSVPFLPDVNKITTLLGAKDSYPKLLDVTVPRTGPFKLYAFCDPSAATTKVMMQPNTYVIGEWEIGAYEGKATGEIRETRVRLNLKPDGMLQVEGAWAVDVYEKEVEAKPEEASAEAAADGAEKKVNKKTVQKQREVCVKPNLEVLGFSSEKVVAFRKLEAEMHDRDASIVRTREKKNELESYILDFRPRLAEGGDLCDYTTPENRSSFVAQCDSDEQWLYDDGDSAEWGAYNERVVALRAVGDAAGNRKRNREDVEFAMHSFTAKMSAAKEMALTKIGKTDHLTEQELLAAAATADEAVAWAKGELAALLAAPKTQDSTFTPASLDAKEATVTQGIRAVVNRPAPPKPKKEEAPAPAPAAAPEEAKPEGEAPEEASGAAEKDELD